MNTRNLCVTRSLAACLAGVVALPAMAHHAMDSNTPRNAFEGFVSGLAHPVIGIDHLLFVIAVGIACYYFGRRRLTPAAFVGGTLAGTALHLYEATLAYPDAWVALSLVGLGVLLVGGGGFLKSRPAIGAFAAAGLVHGYAYGESIIGAEATPLMAYLVGFALVQLLIAAAGFAAARYLDRNRPAWRTLRMSGTALALAGVAMLLVSVVPPS